jgi:uncharacterized protein
MEGICDMRKYSYLSPKCEVRKQSKIDHKGVFANAIICKGELIAIWGGYIITLNEIKKNRNKKVLNEYPVQIYENIFMGPRSYKDLDDCEMFNHCCQPNAGIKGQNILIARKRIKEGEEICFDYETTDTQDLKFLCKCGHSKCRGRINGNSWQNPKFQKSNKGYLSFYIKEKIKRLRKIAFKIEINQINKN